MDSLKKIIKLLTQKKFPEVENALLLELKEDNYKNGIINYYLGILYNHFDNPKKSKEKAKRFFGYAVDSDAPIEDAFIQLSRLETNTNHSIRILRKGLENFPKSVKLYERILWKTEIKERNPIFNEVKNLDIISDNIFIIMLNTFFKEKKFNDALNIISKIKLKDREETLLLNTIKAYCYLENKDIKRAKKLFKEQISEDIKHELHYAPYFGLALCYLQEDRNEKVFAILRDISEESEIDPLLFMFNSPLNFDFEDYFLRVLSEVEKITKDKTILGRVKGLRGLFFYSKDDNGKINSKVIRDLKYANNVFPNNVIFCEHLKWNADEKKNYFDSYKYSIQYIENISEDNLLWADDIGSWDFINDADFENFNKMIKDLKKKVSKRNYLSEKIITKTILTPIIERLFEEEKFSEIIELSEIFYKGYLKDSEVVFHIAYAYSEIDDLSSSEEYYQYHIKKYGITSPVANNLGVIYEKREDLVKAQKFFKKAQKIDPGNDRAKNNLERVTEHLEYQQKEYLEFRKAAKEFDKENPWIQKRIISFAEHRDTNSHIICPYRQLPQFLAVSSVKATELIKKFLDKKYVIKISNHKLNTLSNVYKLNPEIEKQITIIESNLKREGELLAIAEKINLENLEQIGLDENLLSALKKISSQELQKMLGRDLKENALALMTNSHKTALIMSGSIIESVLLDKISFSNIETYKLENGKNKKVNKMDLFELLYVANKEKIIEDQLFHLSHALRGFRNLIHPGVEKRKKAIQISKDNAQIAWDITRKIIIEI